MIIEHEAPDAPNPDAAEIDRIEAILRRYPDATPAEADAAERFLAKAPILQRGLLSSRPGMAAKMNQLRKDRPKAFAPSLTGRAILLFMILAVIVTGFLSINGG